MQLECNICFYSVRILDYTRTSPWTGQRERRVRLHAPVQRGNGQKLPLVNAELGDIFVCFHILRCPLLDSRPGVEVEHLRNKKKRGLVCDWKMCNKLIATV